MTDPVKEGCREIHEVEGLLMPHWVLGLSISSEHPSPVSYALSSSGTCGLLTHKCQTDDGGSGCWVYLQWMASNTQLAGATRLGVAQENEATPKGVSGYVNLIVVMGGPHPNSFCSWALRHAGVFGKAVGSVCTSKLAYLPSTRQN